MVNNLHDFENWYSKINFTIIWPSPNLITLIWNIFYQNFMFSLLRYES